MTNYYPYNPNQTYPQQTYPPDRRLPTTYNAYPNSIYPQTCTTCCKSQPYYADMNYNNVPYQSEAAAFLTANQRLPISQNQYLYPSNSAITYPTTHSIPGPYLQSYINLPNRSYSY